MAQTYYIESDEEIISVIGRLRKSSSEENIFVFPKRALVLQSIINLRLFQREAEKLGKRIVIVSQDEVGRMLAEKAGIETENYSEDFSQKGSHLELKSETTDPALQASALTSSPLNKNIPHSATIGSSDFFVAQDVVPRPKNTSVETEPTQNTIPVRVRNASPPKLTTLNSKRLDQLTPAPQTQYRVPGVTSAPSYIQTSPAQQSKRGSEQVSSTREERLKNFYTGTPKVAPKPVRGVAQSIQTTVGGKAHMILWAVGGVSLFSLVVVALFFFLPKAEVYITPYKIVETVDKEFNSGGSATSEETVLLAVRIIEKDKEVSLTIPTTGKSGGTNQKARGTVIIYNNYSKDVQPLVATTRLETSDGKLFRLAAGVTVPGMTNVSGKTEPGVIEAQVIADQSGTEYNIDASEFTIPGFKGGPKYEKFIAKSTKAMVGGGNSGVADVAVVAKVDTDSVLRDAKEKAKEDFLSEVRDQVASGEKLLDTHIDVAPVGTPDIPTVGTVANAIDFKGVFKVRAVVFAENAVKEGVVNASEKTIQGMRFHPLSSEITYNDSSVDYATSSVRIKAHALVTMESDIDTEKLKGMLLEKNEEGIKQVLQGFPEIKNIQVKFHPEWFVRTIPGSAGRVTLVLNPGEGL